MLVAYLVETLRRRAQKLRAFVRSFGEGLDDEAALTGAFGVDLGAPAGLLRHLRRGRRFKGRRPRCTGRRRDARDRRVGPRRRRRPRRLRRRARRQLPHAGAVGAPLLRARREATAARRLLERAATLVPSTIGRREPGRLLAGSPRCAGRHRRGADGLAEVVPSRHTAIESARQADDAGARPTSRTRRAASGRRAGARRSIRSTPPRTPNSAEPPCAAGRTRRAA